MDVFSTASALGIPPLILLALTLCLCCSWGRFVLQQLGVDPAKRPLESAVFATALGLGILSYATFVMGCLQLYQPPVFKFLFAASLVLHGPSWVRNLRRLPEFIPSWKGILTPGRIAAILLSLIIGLSCLVAALAPDTGFDALNYHLGIPRLFIAAGGIEPLPHLFYSNFPLNIEMLYTFGWLVHSEILAKLFHFAFVLLLFGSLLAFGQRFCCSTVGLWSGLIFVASPIVAGLSQTAYVTLALTLYFFLSLYAFCIWLDTGSRRWLVLAGICSGLAVGTKYTALSLVFLMVLVGAGVYLSQRLGGARPEWRWRDLILCYFLPILMLFLPWLSKNLLFTGNPVAPLLGDWIENPHFAASDYNVWMETLRNWRGFEGGLGDVLRGPWLLTRYSGIFEGNAGVIFLAFFPLAVVLGWRNPTVRLLTAFAALGYCIQILGTKQLRFFVPLFPVLSLVIAQGIVGQDRVSPSATLHFARRPALLLLVGLISVQLPFFLPWWSAYPSLTLAAGTIRPFTSETQRAAYLEKRLPGREALALHRFLEEEIPRGGAALALTPGYQALLGHPLHVLPNNSLATRLSRGFLETALSADGFTRLNLVFPGAGHHRRWRTRITGVDLSGWKSYRPRVFSRRNGMRVEHFVLTARRAGGGLELDLGAPRAVSELVLWERLQGRELSGLAVSLRVGEGSDWREVPFQLQIQGPQFPAVEDLVRGCDNLHITHVFLNAAIPHLEFMTRFFELPGTKPFFSRVHVVGDFHVYRVRMSGPS